MEYAAGVKKAQYNKVKLENRKMLIKPSYLITAVGIAAWHLRYTECRRGCLPPRKQWSSS